MFEGTFAADCPVQGILIQGGEDQEEAVYQVCYDGRKPLFNTRKPYHVVPFDAFTPISKGLRPQS